MMVKLTQDLARGFKPWKDMFLENEATLNALGAKLVFAGTEKDNDNKLTVIIDFESPEAMKAFAGHEELKAEKSRRRRYLGNYRDNTNEWGVLHSVTHS